MATSTQDLKATLAKAKVLFNTFAAQFNAVSPDIAKTPELAPVLAMFQAIADLANAKRQVLVDAIAQVGGLDVPDLTTEQKAQMDAALRGISDVLNSLEQNTGLSVAAFQLRHVAQDATDVSDFVVI